MQLPIKWRREGRILLEDVIVRKLTTLGRSHVACLWKEGGKRADLGEWAAQEFVFIEGFEMLGIPLSSNNEFPFPGRLRYWRTLGGGVRGGMEVVG